MDGRKEGRTRKKKNKETTNTRKEGKKERKEHITRKWGRIIEGGKVKRVRLLPKKGCR